MNDDDDEEAKEEGKLWTFILNEFRFKKELKFHASMNCIFNNSIFSSFLIDLVFKFALARSADIISLRVKTTNDDVNEFQFDFTSHFISNALRWFFCVNNYEKTSSKNY